MKTGSLKSVNNFFKSIDPSDCFKEERQFGIPDSYFKIIYFKLTILLNQYGTIIIISTIIFRSWALAPFVITK